MPLPSRPAPGHLVDLCGRSRGDRAAPGPLLCDRAAGSSSAGTPDHPEGEHEAPEEPQPVEANSRSPTPAGVGTRTARPWMSGTASGRPMARETRTTTSSRPGSSTQADPLGTAEPRLSRVPVTITPSGCSGFAAGRNAAIVRMRRRQGRADGRRTTPHQPSGEARCPAMCRDVSSDLLRVNPSTP